MGTAGKREAKGERNVGCLVRSCGCGGLELLGLRDSVAWLCLVEGDVNFGVVSLERRTKMIAKKGKDMNALEFANANENVIVRIAGNGCPAGMDIAWIPPETELPFDLKDIEGEVCADGYFTATNLTNGPGAYDWKYSDHRGNIIYAIWLRADAKVWQREYNELMA